VNFDRRMFLASSLSERVQGLEGGNWNFLASTPKQKKIIYKETQMMRYIFVHGIALIEAK
jgi:hypothetical protein